MFSDKLFADCRVEENTDYYGNDIVQKNVEGPQACADFCISTVGGLFWTYKSLGDSGVCFVKSSSAGRRLEQNSVSGNLLCGHKTGDRIHLSVFARSTHTTYGAL